MTIKMTIFNVKSNIKSNVKSNVKISPPPPDLSGEFLTIYEIVKYRKITNLYHFTRLSNLDSILNHGLISQKELIESKTIHGCINDNIRLDGYSSGICLSISFPNCHLLNTFMRKYPSDDWIVLEISSDVLWQKECMFFPINAASKLCRDRQPTEFVGAVAFENMFSNVVENKWHHLKRWENDCLRSYDPTDVQAEVICFDRIEPSYFKCISAFNTDNLSDLNIPIAIIKANIHYHMYDYKKGIDGRDCHRKTITLLDEFIIRNNLKR